MGERLPLAALTADVSLAKPFRADDLRKEVAPEFAASHNRSTSTGPSTAR